MRLVTIRRSLYTSLLLAILLLGGALLAAAVVASRVALRGLAADWIAQTTRFVEARLSGFFEPLRSGLLVTSGWAEQGLIDLEPDTTLPALPAMVGPLMRRFPQIAAVLLADERGRELMLVQAGDVWRLRRIDPAAPGEARWQEWRDGDKEPRGSTEKLAYDARQQLWYRGATGRRSRLGKAVGIESSVHWTAPYLRPAGQEPGIAASIAFTGPDGGQRVVAFELHLIDVARFTSALGIKEHGIVFVLDDQDRLVGLPRHERFKDPSALGPALLADVAEVDLPLLAEALKAARAQPDADGVRFHHAGTGWWADQNPFPLSDQRALTIAVAVPEDELVSGLEHLRLTIVLMTAAAVVLAMLRAAALAKRFGEPIEALVRESDRISRGQLESVEHPVTPVVEFRRLARAHDRMRQSLHALLALESEMQVARQIQQSTFPDRLPELPGFELAATSEPAREAGGDTYDAIGFTPGPRPGFPRLVESAATHAILLLADATGHGIGPALLATELRAMVRVALRIGCEPEAIIRHVNAQLHQDLPSGRFVTAWLGVLDSTASTLLSFSAGQAPLLHYVASRDDWTVLGADTYPVGISEDIAIEPRPPLALGPGDVFAVLSDGFLEAAGPDRERFGLERTKAVIHAERHMSAAEILAALRAAVDEFARGEPQSDDRTAVVIKRR